MTRKWRRALQRTVVVLLLGVPLVGGGGSEAQEGTPAASPIAVGAHAAHIHEGTCDNLNPAPTYPLADLRLPEDGAATPAPMGRMTARNEVETSTTTVQVPLDDLLAGRHAISVQERFAQRETAIACGEIAGGVQPHVRALCPGGFMIPLRELNGSGFAGMAWLQPYTDNTTTVTIFMSQRFVGRGLTDCKAVGMHAP